MVGGEDQSQATFVYRAAGSVMALPIVGDFPMKRVCTTTDVSA